MLWILIVVAIIIVVYWIIDSANGSVKDAQKALDIIGDSHSLIQKYFPYTKYRSAWTDIICVESAYLTLIVFVHGMTLDGKGSNRKQEIVKIIIDRWCEFILRVSALSNTPSNIKIIKQKIMMKQRVYVPLIDKYFQDMILNNQRDIGDMVTCENYELYEKFMEFSLENYQEIMSNEYSVLKFHRYQTDNSNFYAIHDSIYTEERNARQNKHDYYQQLRQEGNVSDDDIRIDERVKFIRHHITLLLFCCANYKKERHIN